MHEAGIAKAILDTALKAAPKKSSKIKAIFISVGVLAGIEDECLNMYFKELSKGTRAQGAKLVISKSTGILKCSECDNETPWKTSSPIEISCKKCGGLNILRGDHGVIVDEITVVKK